MNQLRDSAQLQRPRPATTAITMTSKALESILNYLRPHKAEAFVRLRVNVFCLTALAILTYLLPVPSLGSAFTRVLSQEYSESSWEQRWISVAEVGTASIFLLNIAESILGIRYPRAPLPPRTPATKSALTKTPNTTSNARQTPLRELAASVSRTGTPRHSTQFSPASSKVFAPIGSSGYPQSPITTPSRTMNYSLMGSTTTIGSSTSTHIPPTPSPIVSAYRGKQSAANGQSINGAFINRLMVARAEDEEDYE